MMYILSQYLGWCIFLSILDDVHSQRDVKRAEIRSDLTNIVSFSCEWCLSAILRTCVPFLENLDFAKCVVRLQILETADGFTGCFTRVNSLVNFDKETQSIPGRRWCVAEDNTAEYETDPCCNWMLSFSQCCAPRDVLNSVSVIREVCFVVDAVVVYLCDRVHIFRVKKMSTVWTSGRKA